MTDFKISIDEDVKKGKLIATCCDCGKEIDCTQMISHGSLELDGKIVFKLNKDQFVMQCMRCCTIQNIRHFVHELIRHGEDFNAALKSISTLELASDISKLDLENMNASERAMQINCSIDAMRDISNALIRRINWLKDGNEQESKG